MQDHFEQTADRFHIIGHSLGAHIAGDAGSRIPGLARISGERDEVFTADVSDK